MSAWQGKSTLNDGLFVVEHQYLIVANRACVRFERSLWNARFRVVLFVKCKYSNTKTKTGQREKRRNLTPILLAIESVHISAMSRDNTPK